MACIVTTAICSKKVFSCFSPPDTGETAKVFAALLKDAMEVIPRVRVAAFFRRLYSLLSDRHLGAVMCRMRWFRRPARSYFHRRETAVTVL
jgi:hypothetical protein